MSQHNEKNPHQHQSPLHDSSEAKPGMDSLAPEDGSHRPDLCIYICIRYFDVFFLSDLL